MAALPERVIGFIGFQETPGVQSEGEIIGIHVHPDFWRKGAGKALMDAALARMKESGVETAFLWTMSENMLSRAFYEREGFACTQTTRVSTRQTESFEEMKYIKEIKSEPVGGANSFPLLGKP